MNNEKQTNLDNENSLSPKTQELKNYVDNLSLEMVAYSMDAVGSSAQSQLILGTEGGGRVIITRTKPDADMEGHFVQDMSISFHPGRDKTVTYKQLDYNFNEKDDNLLRKRFIAPESKGVENVPSIEHINSLDGEARLDAFALNAMTALSNADNMIANLKLEEEMGVNNQPVGEDEIDALISELQRAKVLDRENGYRPVN